MTETAQQKCLDGFHSSECPSCCMTTEERGAAEEQRHATGPGSATEPTGDKPCDCPTCHYSDEHICPNGIAPPVEPADSASEPQKCPTCGRKTHEWAAERADLDCHDPFHDSTPPARSEDYEHGPGLCHCQEHARKPGHTAKSLAARSEVEGLPMCPTCGDCSLSDYGECEGGCDRTRGVPHRPTSEAVERFYDIASEVRVGGESYRMPVDVILGVAAALRSLSVQPEVERLVEAIRTTGSDDHRGYPHGDKHVVMPGECSVCVALSALLDSQRKPT